MAGINTDLFNKLYIKGAVFALFGKLGPEAIFNYPIPRDIQDQYPPEAATTTVLSERNYMQVAVKSISLLMSDYAFEQTKDSKWENFQIFGVLPYPDINMIGFTLFSYLFIANREEWVPCAFTLMVEENHRNFIYNSIERIEKLMNDFNNDLKKLIIAQNIYSQQEAHPYWVEMIPKFQKFYKTIANIQTRPISPLTSKRRIKILFTGLENTGKTSFLLTIKREFSSLPSLLPTTETIKEKLDFLGTTIMKWDIPGTKKNRESILQESEVYLYETDLIYYFADLQNPNLSESASYLQDLVSIINTYESPIPIIFILTKFDEDIKHSKLIQENLYEIQKKFRTITENIPIKFFQTSIFSIYSVLNAFSYGIRQLAPNRAILEHLLWEFIARLDFNTGLLLNENGIVLASAEIEDENENQYLEHSQIFEIAAPQFTTIASQFNQYRQQKKEDLIKYQFSDEDFVLLQKFQIESFPLYALFYTKQPINKSSELFLEHFPKFQEKIANLLKNYIA